MGRNSRRLGKLRAPLWQGALPTLPANPVAPTTPGYVPMVTSAEMRRQTAAEQLQRSTVRPVIWTLDCTGAFLAPVVSEILVSVRGPALVRATDIVGLVSTGVIADSYTATLSAYTRGNFNPIITPGGGPNAAQNAGALAGRRSYVFLPFAGEWTVRMELLGPMGQVAISGQVYEGLPTDFLASYACGGSNAQGRAITVPLSDVLPIRRIGDSVNIRRVTVAQSSSTTPGGSNVLVLIGSGFTPFNMLSAGLNVNNPRMVFDVQMESVVLQFATAGPNSCNVVAQIEYE